MQPEGALKECVEARVDWDNIKNVHLIAICGKGMGALASLLKADGYHVTGTDENVFPPMSTFLEEQGIELIQGYQPEKLPKHIDCIIVGNACRRDHPQVLEAVRRKIPLRSFPATIGEHFMKDRTSVVIAGTHGKTTTTAMISALLLKARRDPSWLVGGVPRDLPLPTQLGKGKYFVIEGDEYDSAFYNKVPKFLHYKPHQVILTSVEYDHADIYPDIESVKKAFCDLMELVPRDGQVLAWVGGAHVREVVKNTKAPVVYYGLATDFKKGDKRQWYANIIEEGSFGTKFSLWRDSKEVGVFETGLSGHHNIRNWTAALAQVFSLKLSFDEVVATVRDFQGVKGRQEIVGTVGSCVVIDDFAHHPTAVLETLRGLRARYHDRRIWGVFEPRTQTSCRRVFQKEYEAAFEDCDIAVIAEPGRKLTLPPDQIFSSQELVDGIKARGHEAYVGPTTDAIVELIGQKATRGDVFVFMSNGSFNGIHQKALACLKTKNFSAN